MRVVVLYVKAKSSYTGSAVKDKDTLQEGWLEECEALPSGWLSDQNCWWHDACKYKYEDCSEVSTAAAQHLPPNKWAPI